MADDLTLSTPLGEAKDPGPPPPPPAPGIPAEPAARPADLATWYKGEMDTLIPKFEAASKAAHESIASQQRQLGEYKVKALGAPGMPESPGLPEAPAAPKITARPFLEGMPGEDPIQGLNKAMAGFGLMAQMAVGIKGGFPAGALAAYTGALEGWKAGDQRRAANQWQTYMGELKKHDNDVQAIRLKYDDAVRKWGGDQDKLKTELGILAAEHGLGREAIELAFKEPTRAYEMVNSQAKLLSDMQQSAASLALKNAMWLDDRAIKLQDLAIKQQDLARKNKIQEQTEKLFDRVFGGEGQPGGGAGGLGKFDPKLSFGPSGPTITLEPSRIGETTQTALRAYDSILAATKDLRNSFSDKEIETYVGLLQKPMQDVKLALSSIPGMEGMADARYAAFKTLTGRLTGTAFGEGGKQLTPFEASVVFSYTPTGSEPGGAPQFKAKLESLERFTQVRRDLAAYYAGRGTDPSSVPSHLWDQGMQTGLATSGVKVPKATPSSGWGKAELVR